MEEKPLQPFHERKPHYLLQPPRGRQLIQNYSNGPRTEPQTRPDAELCYLLARTTKSTKLQRSSGWAHLIPFLFFPLISRKQKKAFGHHCGSLATGLVVVHCWYVHAINSRFGWLQARAASSSWRVFLWLCLWSKRWWSSPPLLGCPFTPGKKDMCQDHAGGL